MPGVGASEDFCSGHAEAALGAAALLQEQRLKTVIAGGSPAEAAMHGGGLAGGQARGDSCGRDRRGGGVDPRTILLRLPPTQNFTFRPAVNTS